MSEKENDDIDDGEFTPRERRRIRKLLQDEAKSDAIRAALKTWIVTIGAIMSAVAIIKLGLYDFFKWVTR